jgi:hypothetical protein
MIAKASKSRFAEMVILFSQLKAELTKIFSSIMKCLSSSTLLPDGKASHTF